MARPDDWIGRTVIIGTDMYGGDTMGTLEEVSDRGVVVRHEIVEIESEMVEIESEVESKVVEIEAESEAQLQSMRRNTLTEPGCVFMHLVQPQDDPDSWVMLEMFRSRAAWDEHMRQPYNVQGNVILEDLLREPSELRFFDEM